MPEGVWFHYPQAGALAGASQHTTFSYRRPRLPCAGAVQLDQQHPVTC